MGHQVLTLELPRGDKIHSYFIASDWHDFNLCEKTLNILLTMAKNQPRARRRLIINGDFLDLPEFMERNPDYKKWIKRPDGLEYYFKPAAERAFEWGNAMLDRLQKIFVDIWFVEGNHDWRLQGFVEKTGYDIPTTAAGLKLAEREIPFVAYNDWLDVGDVSITHGMYHSKTTAHKRHFETAGRSVIFGHIHEMGCRAFVRRGDTVHVWSLPCMCELAPEYIKNRDNNWTKGFGLLHVTSTGKTHFWPAAVIDDQVILPHGLIIKG